MNLKPEQPEPAGEAAAIRFPALAVTAAATETVTPAALPYYYYYYYYY